MHTKLASTPVREDGGTFAVLAATRDICLQTVLAVSENNEALATASVSTANDLNQTVKLINNVVENELIRRYGDLK